MSEPRMYRDLSAWWPILSSPKDYEEEAAFFRREIERVSRIPVKTLLELGSGGGNNASHLKVHFALTLVDLSPGMLANSRALNPECGHVLGDMRSVRLGREFDAVFVHDAVGYMRSVDDLRSAMATAFAHCKKGGAALFAPDHVRENFRPSTSHGGHDGPGRAMRYLEWTWDPDPADSTYVCDFAYLFRDGDGNVSVEHDRHHFGLFDRETWLTLLKDVGFQAKSVPFEHSELEPGSAEVFLAWREAC